ncbi:MAG: DUF192 domain-containing protein [Alphaproteobacteria bacterium]
MIKYCVALLGFIGFFLFSFAFEHGVFADGGAVKIPPPIEGVPPEVFNSPQVLDSKVIQVVTSDGVDRSFNVEIADSEEERRIGMMFRTDVPVGTGMLFVFDNDAERHFWMRNTLVPLDIIFIRGDGVIIKIHHSAEPKSLRLLPSEAKARGALELYGGEALKNNINIGDRVIYNVFNGGVVNDVQGDNGIE